MPRLTLHIGQGKTGSSLIQATCSLNRSKLAHQFQLVYPGLPNDPFSYEPTHHEFFFRNPDYHPIGKVQDYLLGALRLCGSVGAGHLLLSWENFQDEEWIDQLARAVRPFDVDVRIVVYLRRQDAWIESSWKQWYNKLVGDPSIAQYAATVNCDWYAWLERWAARFGRERIKVRPYEKAQMPNGLLADFFEAIDYPAAVAGAMEPPPTSNSVVNKGFRPAVMDVLSLSKELNRGRHDNRLFDAFSELLSEPFKKREFENYGLLTPEQRLEILEKYEPSNRKIAIEYLGRSDGRLFHEPWPDKSGAPEPPPELTIEGVVPIFVDMIVRLNDRVRTLEAALGTTSDAAPSGKAPAN